MSAKPEIISRLGEKDLLLPHLIEDALAWNPTVALGANVGARRGSGC